MNNIDKNNDIGFDKIYPFATENVKDYFEKMDLEGKDILVVGSSCDQIFNAQLHNPKSITHFDINPNCSEYYELKKAAILSFISRNQLLNFLYTDKLNIEDYKKVKQLLIEQSKDGFEFWNNLIEKHGYEKASQLVFSKDQLDLNAIIKSNNYLENNENYAKLRKIVNNNNVNFITGDIFNPKELENKKFDVIILSNILQYVEYFSNGNNSYDVLKNCFDNLKKHLNENGVMQLLYLYSFKQDDIAKTTHPIATYNLRNVINALQEKNLDIEFIDGITENTDAVVYYTNKTK